MKLQAANASTGELEVLTKECETDVLAVYVTDDNSRLAMHIENKLAGGSFTPNQPELYRERKEQWRGKPKLGMYTDATTVLVAPTAFYERFPDKSAIFDTFISHEELAEHNQAFEVD